MATADAGQSGILTIGNAAGQTDQANSMWNWLPAFYSTTLIPCFKMQGKCSIDGWDSWVNNTGNEVGRPIHGVQEPGTVVASWFIPEGGT